MYFTYISPEGSCYYNDRPEKNGVNEMYSHLENIVYDYPNAMLYLSGDMNCRCKA